MSDTQENKGELGFNLNTDPENLSESSDGLDPSEGNPKDEWGDQGEDEETDLSFLDDEDDQGEDDAKKAQQQKSVDGQVRSDYEKLMQIADTKEAQAALKKLPDYIQKWIIKIDKEKRPHLYNNAKIVDDESIKEQVKNVMKQEAVINEQWKKLEEIKATIPKTLSKQKQADLRKVYKDNLEDWLKPARALKDAIKELWIEVSKKNSAKIPWTSKSTKQDESNKRDKHLFERPKWLQDKPKKKV